MASAAKEIAVDLPPFLRLFTDGSIERIQPPPQRIPTSDDPSAAVRSKDVIIDPTTGLSVRIFAPRRRERPSQKLPLVVHIHGGGFCLGSAADPSIHGFVATLVERGDVVAVSVDYRLAPENPMPIPFDDSWAAFRWACGGGDPWLSELADFRRVFVGGESAGATIANEVAVRAGAAAAAGGGGGGGAEVVGLYLVHPYFGGKELSKLYRALFPGSSGGDDDPRLNPVVDSRIGQMAGRRVVFLVAEKDFVSEKAKAYYEGLKKSEWRGEVEIMESEGEEHCFHFSKPTCDKAVELMDRLVSFIHLK